MISKQTIKFRSNGSRLVGNLFQPSIRKACAPVVVVAGAWTTIKEQMGGLYARKLAEKGLSAFVFDFRTWGDSGGKTRSLEDPQMKIADILAAVSMLGDRGEVSEVYGLGVCAGAGYIAGAAARSRKITRISLIASWLHDATIANQAYGGEEADARLLAKSDAAAEREHHSGRPSHILASGLRGSGALMEAVDYYLNPKRGGLSFWQNSFNLASWRPWLTFDAQDTAHDIRQPTLMIHSDTAVIPEAAKAFHAKLRCQKKLVLLKGVRQFDFYDHGPVVSTVINHVLEHFSFTAPAREFRVFREEFLNETQA